MADINTGMNGFYQKNGWITAQKQVEFSGTYSGTGGTAVPVTLFTVSGLVKARVYALCTKALAGASATISVGTSMSGGTATIIASTTATNLIAKEIWHDNSPDAQVELTSVITDKLVTNDIILTKRTALLTAGTAVFVCEWLPVTVGSSVY